MSFLCMAFGVTLAGLLVALAIADARRMILPDGVNALLAIAGLAQSIVVGQPTLPDAVLGGLVGGGLLLGVARLYKLSRGIDGLGLGDVKLAAAGAVWVGVAGIGVMLLVATMSCAAVILLRAASGQSVDRHMRFPFGPYLALGVFAAWATARWTF